MSYREFQLQVFLEKSLSLTCRSLQLEWPQNGSIEKNDFLYLVFLLLYINLPNILKLSNFWRTMVSIQLDPPLPDYPFICQSGSPTYTCLFMSNPAVYLSNNMKGCRRSYKLWVKRDIGVRFLIL